MSEPMATDPKGLAFKSKGPGDSLRAGQILGELLQEGDVVGLIGNLGAGKTLLVQGMAAGLQIPKSVRVTSPTFSLVNEYSGGRLAMVHVDLYRIEEESEFEHIGLEEMLDRAGVSAVEWSDRFEVLPHEHLQVRIDILGEALREFRLVPHGARAWRLAKQWAEAYAASS